MSIYEAIFDRYSVREYQMEKIEPERLEALKRYLKTVALLDEEKPVEFEIVDNTDKKLKVHGLWKTEAPYYLAVYCGDDRLSMRVRSRAGSPLPYIEGTRNLLSRRDKSRGG